MTDAFIFFIKVSHCNITFLKEIEKERPNRCGHRKGFRPQDLASVLKRNIQPAFKSSMSLPFAMDVKMRTAGRKETGLGRSSSVADRQRQSQKPRCNEVEAHLHILPDGAVKIHREAPF